MSLRPAAISKAVFTAIIDGETILPATSRDVLNIPINFANVVDLRKFTGTYTPNDDTKNLINGDATFAPNFLLVSCDGQLNLDVLDAQYTRPIVFLPVIKFAFISLASIPGSPISNLWLEGRLISPLPMPQNVPVNYTIFAGRADIS